MPISIPTSVAGISVPGAINGPLSLLYGNKYLKDSYAFPRDLGSNPARNHVIWFDIMTPVPGNLAAIANVNPKDALDGIVQLTGGVVAATTQATAGNIDAAVGTLGTTARTFGESKIGIATAQTLQDMTKTKLDRRASKSIALYVPDTVNVSYSVKYSDDFSIADALGKSYYLAQGAVSLFNTFKDQGDLKASNLLNQAGNDPFIRAFVADKLGAATGTNLKELALNAGGYAMNPQLQVLFSNIGFREFQFDFVLTPSTKEESITIKKIIEEFKYAAAPELISNGVFTQSLFMKIPDTFKIKFLYNGAENPNVHKIEECVLTNINVDYAPNGWSTFNDGSPVQTRLTLQFTETIIIDKKKVREGY
jgi:hypothetical protein